MECYNIPKSCGSDFTFYHYNGRDASQIDYFMQSSDLISTYITFDREPTNSSTHNPILVKILCEIKLSNQRDGKLNQLRINWNKIDKKGYEEEVESRLALIDDNELILTCDNISDNINSICKILSESAVKNSSVPVNRRKRTGKPRKKPWAPEIASAAKSSKIHHAKWKAAGKPTNPENEIYKNNKNSKKKLRSLQRRLEATNRNNKYQELMELNERNDKGFYKLVRKQRDPSNPSGSSLIFKDNTLNDQIEITEAFAQYFEELSTPCENVNFDNDHFTNVKRDITSLTELFKHSKNHNIPVTTTEEVKKTVLSFKNGKSPDEENITAEHVKFGGHTLISILTNIINFIFQNLDIPSLLKSGIACPILKKGKKKTDPNSYRKIVITMFIGKIVEKLHLQNNQDSINKQQSRLQKGFTKGQMPAIAALILTELITEANKSNSSLYIALMDAKKAFDILWHLGLLREMYNFGLHGDNWLFFKNWYEEVTSKIKWNGNISRPIQEQQGVRQGGVWSPTAYKIFINKLLKTFEKNQLGAYIGCTYCGIPTVADDVTFISKSPTELQTMLDIQAYYANKQRYLLSEQKSTILVLNDKENRSWSLNNKDLSTSESAVHLGIERDSTSKSGSKEVICKRVITARKTTYSLMEAENKSTLKYLNLSDTVPGKPHNIWTSCGNEPFAIIMAHLKAKIAVGTIVLQSSKAKHSKSEVSPICQLCHIETEDMIHFLIKCTVLKTTRSPFLQELKTFVKTCLRGENDETLFHELFNNNEYLARLIIDCSFFHFLKNTEKTRIETISRGLCYKLYQRRATILAENS
ncbi:unnamed protein product [Mytilus edulis]|uniref:Reverse transcriptase domain-containing protein n=1 Tax=Mytilus edulis TaxID=6550 RepID=A0A8S3U9T1_MYTED|nr:unnamed protein product [Mytilus edulis]